MNIIQRWREKYGFSRTQAAEILGTSPTTLARWEKRHNHEIPPEAFRSVCLLLGHEYYEAFVIRDNGHS